jgi:glycosyltransferase involved in cell wall biosynthesis
VKILSGLMNNPELSSQPLILQVCPNDHPPFRDLCATYQQAGESLGCRVETVFLSAPFSETTQPDAHYLSVSDSGQRRLTKAFRQRLQAIDATPLLTVCHRYRALRTVVASGLTSHLTIAVAHEFGMLKRVQRRVNRLLFARKVLFAGVSPPVQAELSRVVNDALLLPNVIDLPKFDASVLSRDQALAELQLPAAPDLLTVAVVGRLIPWKRPELALSALRVLDDRQDIRLVFVGDGPLNDALSQQSSGLPVHFVGFKDNARSLLRAFDVLLIVSEDREAFGMVALEAMAAGVPVLAQTAPGPGFVLGENAYYCAADPASIATGLIQVGEARRNGHTRAVSDAARRRVERDFSVAALAARLDDLFFQGRMG